MRGQEVFYVAAEGPLLQRGYVVVDLHSSNDALETLSQISQEHRRPDLTLQLQSYMEIFLEVSNAQAADDVDLAC